MSDSQNYPLAVQWLAENMPSWASGRVPQTNALLGLPAVAGSRNATKVSMISLKKMVKKPTLESVRPIVQEAPEKKALYDVFRVDVSTDRRHIVVLTGSKLLTYEGDSGRLINTFELSCNPSEVYFREGNSSSVLLVNQYTKKIFVLNTSDGRLNTLASETQGIPVGYDPATDSMILFTAFLNAGHGDVGGEIAALDLKTGAVKSKGAINTGLRGQVRAFVRDDGELGVVGLYNDAGEGIQPIDCFATKKNGQWVVMSEESAVAGVKNFLRLPQSARQLSHSIYGTTEFEFSGKRFLLDEMLATSARAGVLPLDNSPLQTIYAYDSKGSFLKFIPLGTIRQVDGISASDDGNKLVAWNINEKWVKEKLAPEWHNFRLYGQKDAMRLPPLLLDLEGFEYEDLPIGDRMVWVSQMSSDGKHVGIVASDLKSMPVPEATEKWGCVINESSLPTKARVYNLADFSSFDSSESGQILPLGMEDGVKSVWFGDQANIAFSEGYYSGGSTRWAIGANNNPALSRLQPWEEAPDEAFVTHCKLGRSASVKNATAWNQKGEYVLSSTLSVVGEDEGSSAQIELDYHVELAAPIESGKLLVHANEFIFIFDCRRRVITGCVETGYLDKRRKLVSVCPDRRRLWYREPSGNSIRLLSWTPEGTLSEDLRIFPQLQGRPVYLTSDGFYASPSTRKVDLHFSDGERTYPFEQFDLRLNRPDIVLERFGSPAEAVAIAKQLREKRLKRMGVTEKMLKPDFHVPELEIVGDVPATTDANEISLAIKANDTKYPLDRLKVFVNNVPVNGRDGESLRDQNTQALERGIPVKLASGRNKIQVSVLNNAGAESLYANAEVNCTAKRPKPTLYAVALGVSDYANPDWNLKYAAKDAKDVLERLKTSSGGSYGEVRELLLTDKDVTKDSLAKIKDFLSAATIDDTVLMFVAGHGLLDSKYDYYFGTTDIEFDNPAEKGIAFDEFDDLLAGLPSLKKSLLIDTCHAGELDEEEKTLLASAGGYAAPLPTGNGIAMRSIGTRGMNVKAIEGARGASEWYDRLQGLFVDLRRGSGSTILSSSAGAEYALESSEQQNGLFTYAVLEALDGTKDADTNKDGSVQMSELGEYVKKRVSELTNNKQTPNTRRVNLEGDFTLARTK
jgi:hypothetical protein